MTCFVPTGSIYSGRSILLPATVAITLQVAAVASLSLSFADPTAMSLVRFCCARRRERGLGGISLAPAWYERVVWERVDTDSFAKQTWCINLVNWCCVLSHGRGI
jgi:hypothetical protein